MLLILKIRYFYRRIACTKNTVPYTYYPGYGTGTVRVNLNPLVDLNYARYPIINYNPSSLFSFFTPILALMSSLEDETLVSSRDVLLSRESESAYVGVGLTAVVKISHPKSRRDERGRFSSLSAHSNRIHAKYI